MESKKKWIWISAAIVAALLGWNVYQRQGVPILEKDTESEIVCVLDYRNGIYAEWNGNAVHGVDYPEIYAAHGAHFGEQDVMGQVDKEKLLDLLVVYQRRRGSFDKSDQIFVDGAQIEICGKNEGGCFGVLLGERNAFYQKKGDAVCQYWILDSDTLLQEVLALADG